MSNAKIKRVKRALSEWNKRVFGNIFIQKATLKDIIRVKEAQLEINLSLNSRSKLKKAEAELKQVLHIKET